MWYPLKSLHSEDWSSLSDGDVKHRWSVNIYGISLKPESILDNLFKKKKKEL